MTRANSATAEQLFAAAINEHRAGRLAEADRLYRQILSVDPGHADSLHLLGIVAHQRGQHETAADLIGKAIARGAPTAPYHYNRGLALAALGRSHQAADEFGRAIALKTDYAEAHLNLGDALRLQGQYERALDSYRQAAALRPAFAEAHNSVGAMLLTLGRSVEAVPHCERAVALKPDLFEAHTNLAKLLYAAGHAVQATAHVARALALRETIEAKALFVRCVRDIKATGDVGTLRSLVLRAITEPWGRPNELTAVAISILRLDDPLREAISRAAAAWPGFLPAQDATSPALSAAFSDPLFLRLLETVHITDVGLEQLLTGVRYALLDMATRATPSDAIDPQTLAFFCALARQCFVNEYVFSCGEDEAAEAQTLHDALGAALQSGEPVSPLWPVAVAAYSPLSSLPGADALDARAWPDTIAAVLRQQIGEPRTEQELRASIPQLTPISDDISLKVREMYEENPYPRWIKVAPSDSRKPLGVYLRERFLAAPLGDIEHNAQLDILIGGCGTGRQAVEMAQRFTGARVLALDLSLASLGYAKRKTQELGIDNVDYAQADILQVAQIGRTFDLIESSGVLHHLDDPWAGWRALLALLRPGGFMRIGLYSEIGRPGVIAGRALVAERRYPPTPNGIRQFRQELIAGNYGPPLSDLVNKTSDFFSTSEVRDLVFHVREHRMTTPQIGAFLRANELAFIGFELDARVAQQYRGRFPDDVAMTNLDQWHVFETENPDSFLATYQFWVRGKL